MYLLLPHLTIQNANAISSPLTWGFPSITAFLGAAHALERKINELYSVKFEGVGVICHDFVPQTYRPEGKSERYFCLARQPLDKDGSTKSIVEEGRAHLEISLLIQVNDRDLKKDDRQACLDLITSLLPAMRIAGGSVFLSRSKRHQVEFGSWPEEDAHEDHRRLRNKLLPGFVLISQHQQFELFYQTLKTERPDCHRVDALIEMCSLRSAYQFHEIESKSGWQFIPRQGGWLVPISVGYSTISPLYAAGEMKGCRDQHYSAAFVEAVYSMGEWKSPHRISQVEEILWRYQHNESGLYLCVNENH